MSSGETDPGDAQRVLLTIARRRAELLGDRSLDERERRELASMLDARDQGALIERTIAQSRRWAARGVPWAKCAALVTAWRPAVLETLCAELPRDALRGALATADALSQRALSAAAEAYIAYEASQRAAAERELEELVYVTSHDLRAPLRALRFVTEWLHQDLEQTVGAQLSDDAREFLTLIVQRVRRLDAMLVGLLEYSRASRDVPTSVVNIAQLLNEVIEEVSVEANEARAGDRHAYSFEVRSTPSESVVTTRAPLRAVLKHLLTNAARYAGERGASCTIDVERRERSLVITVDDDGPGIPEPQRASALKIFTTLAPRDEFEATGMGLAIVHKLIARFGERLQLALSPAGGLRVQFRWELE